MSKEPPVLDLIVHKKEGPKEREKRQAGRREVVCLDLECREDVTERKSRLGKSCKDALRHRSGLC